MASVNKVILVGYLGSDPELRYTPAGQAVVTFNIATSETWLDKQGQKQQRTEWHRLVIWGKQAELSAQYLSKGQQIYIEGRLQSREWNDKEGAKRQTTEVVVSKVVFLGSRGASSGDQMSVSNNTQSSHTSRPYVEQQTSTMQSQSSGSSSSDADFDYGSPILDSDVPF